MDQQHHHDQYDDEHDESLEPEYYGHAGDSWPLDESNPHAEDADDDYDGDVNDYAQNAEYEHDHGDQNADYEPPSPSHPYPEDQQPPELDIPAEDLNDQEYDDDQNRHIRHSEIYEHDAVSGTLVDRDSSIISEYLRSKDPDWDNVDQRRTELQNLLDLPVDILRLIVKEASQTHPYNLIQAHPTLFPACLPTDDQSPDHTYQRPDVFGADQLDLPQPCHPSYLLTFRYRLARRPHYHSRRQERRCFDIWAINFMYGKCLRPCHKTV